MSPPDWLPNFQNQNAYPPVDKTLPRIWAWEYLRRNKNYILDCDQIGLEWFLKLRDVFFLEALNDQKPEMTVEKMADYANIAYEKVNPPTEVDEFCLRYQLFIPDHPSQSCPITVFLTDLGCYRGAPESLNFSLNLYSPYRNAQNLRMECRKGMVINRLKRFDELTHGILERDPGGETHRNYLRVLDANECGFPDEKIAEVVYGDRRKTSTVEKAFLTAMDFVEKKYIALPAPFAPKKHKI